MWQSTSSAHRNVCRGLGVRSSGRRPCRVLRASGQSDVGGEVDLWRCPVGARLGFFLVVVGDPLGELLMGFWMGFWMVLQNVWFYEILSRTNYDDLKSFSVTGMMESWWVGPTRVRRVIPKWQSLFQLFSGEFWNSSAINLVNVHFKRY